MPADTQRIHFCALGAENDAKIGVLFYLRDQTVIEWGATVIDTPKSPGPIHMHYRR